MEAERSKDIDDDESRNPNCVPSDSDNDTEENDEISAKQTKKIPEEQGNSGKRYIYKSGKVIQELTIRQLVNCRNKCKENLTFEQQQLIFQEFWNLGSDELRQTFAADCFKIEDTKSENKETSLTNPKKRIHTSNNFGFFLEISGKKVSVCKKCLRYTLSVSERFIKSVVKKKLKEYPDPLRMSSKKEKEVSEFIESFPSYESHYTSRDTSKKYLSSDLSVPELFRLYSEKYNSVITLPKFSEIFNTLNLEFKKPKWETCHKCEDLKMKIENLKKELEHHDLEADSACKCKAEDKSKAKDDTSIKLLTFDLQQCLPTPSLRSPDSVYKRKLWTYKLTVHDCKTGEPVCYMWHEAVGKRGGNEIASCLFDYLQNLPTDVKHIILYSNCCSGQNKISCIASMFATFLQLENAVQFIDYKFLLPGHTEDHAKKTKIKTEDHDLIEKKKELPTVEIPHPREWYQFVRIKHEVEVKEINQDQIYNFSAISKEKIIWRKVDDYGRKFIWQDVKWMRFKREFGTVPIHYKTSLSETDEFRKLNIKRQDPNTIRVTDLPKCYSTALAITEKKKQDLLAMLPLIDKMYHSFYQDLNVKKMKDFHPDLTEGDDEGSQAED